MTLESLQPFLHWIVEHPTLSGFAVFLISLSESLAIIGLIVPGVIFMTAIGSLIGAGKLPGVETMIWAMLGAIAGDGLSYWLGYCYKNSLSELWPFKYFPNWLDRGTLFFKSHGGKSIILGRFIGPIRPTIPVIAGIMGMAPKTFLFFNIVSAIAWAPIYCLPGILIGVSLGQLSPVMASTVLSLILGLLLILWLFFYLILKIIIYIERSGYKFFKKLYIGWEQSNSSLPRLRQAIIAVKYRNQARKYWRNIAVLCIMLIFFSGVYLGIYWFSDWKQQWPMQTLNSKAWWKSPTSDILYRSGFLKHNMLPFDLNWVGDLDAIERTLSNNGWVRLPNLTFESGIMMLSERPSANLLLSFPKLHRNRSPKVVFTKVLKENSQRLVLQLWASDYVTAGGLPLWVGTLRVETIKQWVKIITVSYYLEDVIQINKLQLITDFMANLGNQWKYKKIKLAEPIVLIAP